MTLEEFGRFLHTKSVGRIEAPVNEQLTERVYTAMKHIARNTTVLKYTITDEIESQEYQIMKREDENTWVRFPIKPIIDSGDELDIDDILLDALALYVMAGLEMQRSKILMGMYWEEIDANNARLTSTYLQEASNGSERFNVFP
jgi:hypothetical protein